MSVKECALRNSTVCVHACVIYMLHVLSTYVHEQLKRVCVKCWTGTEAIEVETLTHNNVAVPRLPACGETSTEPCESSVETTHLSCGFISS